MFSNKKIAIFLSLILFFALGLLLGFTSASFVNKPEQPVTGKNDCAAGNNNFPAVVKSKTDLTAGEALAIAGGEARQWSADAYLSEIDLASQKFDSAGASNGWKIVFYSKTKNKLYEILIKDGESRGGEEKAYAGKKPPQTLKGELVDSSVLAKSFFSAYPAETEIISLKMYYDAGAKKFIWTVFFPKGSHTIDAEL